MIQLLFSWQIQLFEYVFGIVLFECSSWQVSLIVVGECFLWDVWYIFEFFVCVEQVVQCVVYGGVGCIMFGFMVVSVYWMILVLFVYVVYVLLDVDVELCEMVLIVQIDVFVLWMFDVGFVCQCVVCQLFEYWFVQCELMFVVVVEGVLFVIYEQIGFDEFDWQLFIVYLLNEGKYFYDMILGMFVGVGWLLNYLYYVGQMYMIFGFVCVGFGVVLVLVLVCEFYVDGVVFWLLVGVNVVVELYFVWCVDNDNLVLLVFNVMVEWFLIDSVDDLGVQWCLFV